MIGYALKTWKRLAFPALLFWILAVCLLGIAGQMGWELRQEKNQPCQLTASASGALDLDAVVQLDGVTACTKVYEISAELTVSGYTGSLTVYGVDSGFVEGTVSSGVLFPESAAMPYLVLNEAALKALTLDGKPVEDPDSVDWLNSSVLLGETTAKLCGVVKDDRDTPLAYMGQNAARDYLVGTSGTAGTDLIWVKLRNFGASESVAQALAGVGYTVESQDGDARDWDVRGAELRGYILSGVIAALASAAILAKEVQRNRERSAREFAPWPSAGLNALRILILVCCGLLLGALLLAAKALLHF